MSCLCLQPWLVGQGGETGQAEGDVLCGALDPTRARLSAQHVPICLANKL